MVITSNMWQSAEEGVGFQPFLSIAMLRDKSIDKQLEAIN